MEQTFMKERPVLPLLLSMSLPMVLSMMVNALYNIVDSYFVAQISESAMTALSLVYPVQNFINAAAIGFGVGINAVIAFYLGAGRQRTASLAASLGLLLSVLHGVLLSIVSIFIIPHFLNLFTSDQEVIASGVQYARITFGFAAVIAAELCFEKLFQAVGKMTVSMLAMLIGCIANILLDPLLIFGIGPFPALGISGAALATVIGQVLTLMIYLIIYFTRPLPVKISFRNLQFPRELIGKLYSIGIPAVLNLALPSLLVSALNAILAAFSQDAVLVLGVYYKLQNFLYLPANGIIQGMRPLIGYNYGAGEHRRVQKLYTLTLTLCASIMVLGTICCLAVPETLIGLFTTNEQTVETGAAALRIISAGFIVSSVSVTSAGALEGLGMGAPSLLISLLRYIVIIIPAALLLSRFLGVNGVWHAFWIAELITSAVAWVIYKKASRRSVSRKGQPG
ncbi:MATE efflux family protein [Marvinbryantia formatexigens DSM 14469]|uniref:Probable multidrug resistance protein NorM n=1 Tax=Marvinbryantia formatexigens DSM 14469 TaxID=478749 RepID=C6LGH3_9FIRM|nr:MATE family efflux transporter [Marvinbryantia formatexigens]EET60173.1 MATE efflux family protein [Marvinbryantia formatexigens DSM 14469]UWO24201.1 MATE family efflux transporter [Marvinbryantia formatexigens DSM 14469]SDF59926.1 putative efflux protein, MATE family [Marvinbryantia formatexigens]